MRSSDWNDPQICEIGRHWAREAYDLASQLDEYGADAARFVSVRWVAGEMPSGGDYPEGTPSHVCVPTMFADMLMCLLLSLPRHEKWMPDVPLGENVTVLKRRPGPPRFGSGNPDAA